MRVEATQAPAPVVEPEPEEWLEPSVIAYRLRLSDAHVRKLCQRAHFSGLRGVRRDGARWKATMQAIEAVRRGG